MTDPELLELAAALKALAVEVDTALTASTQSARPVTLDQQAVGRISRVDAIQAQQMAVRSRDALRIKAQLVRQAIRALSDGTYGECRRCELPIDYRRLKARPEAPLCLECQSADGR